ncbi:MAG: hypothetical protein SR1Q7_03970 [Quinella sp. 1Q7]|nr:hypothetical protein [Quinella sp. 1Q7]
MFGCIACGKRPLTKNEIGISKKLLGAQSESFYCVECLANFLEVEPQDILDKIEDFKHDGCKLFE